MQTQLKKQATRLLLGVTISSMLLTLPGCNKASASQEQSESATTKSIPVKTKTVSQQQVSFPINSSGKISAHTESKLSFKTSGIIQQIIANEGDKVKKGQLLARLNMNEIEAAVLQAKAAVAKSIRDFNRAEALYIDTVATLERMQNAQTALDVANANLNIAEYNRKFSSIYAPEEGIIMRKFQEQNELTLAGTPVFLFATTQKNWKLSIGLSDKEVVKLAIGDSASIVLDAWPNKNIPGKISQIGNAPGWRSGLYEVEISISAPNLNIKPGFFANAKIYPSETTNCYLIPVDAIHQGKNDTVSLFTVSSNHQQAKEKAVKVLGILNDQIVVPSNSFEDEALVITETPKELRDLAQIKIIN